MSQRDGGSSNGGGGAENRGQSYRDFVLQVPGGGLTPGSDEANALQSAEVFLSDLEHEIAAYDRANADAVKSRVSRWFGFGSSNTGSEAIGAVGPTDSTTNAEVISSATTVAAAAAVATDSHLRLERRSANDLGRSSAVGQPPSRGWFRWFRRSNGPSMSYEHRTPLLMRRWVPYVCLAAIGMVWIPDMYKLRALHYCDARYAKFRRDIHTEYWRWTMPADEFAELMQQIEAQIPKHRRSVKSSDCPF